MQWKIQKSKLPCKKGELKTIGLIWDHYGCDFEMGRQQSWKDECRSYLNLNDEPLEKRTGLGFGLGSSKSLKKAWCSTQIFQKDLQKSRLAIRNSRVSWNELWKLRYHLQCKQTSNICYRDALAKQVLCYNGKKKKKSFSQIICFQA